VAIGNGMLGAALVRLAKQAFFANQATGYFLLSANLPPILPIPLREVLWRFEDHFVISVELPNDAFTPEFNDGAIMRWQ
jgi:hypothetical protein